jgi:hypothetical protein
MKTGTSPTNQGGMPDLESFEGPTHDGQMDHSDADGGEKMDANAILIAEFEYATQTAFQANEDRARVTSFYFVSVGSFIATILSTQLLNIKDPFINWSYAALFAFLTAMGILTLLQLIRLRKAWFDSALTMNQVKEYYTKQLRPLGIETAFHWKTNTLPKPNKSNSLSFLQALQVALLDTFSVGFSTYFILAGFHLSSWPLIILVSLASLVGQIWLYRRLV